MKKYYYDKTKAQKQELYCLGIDLDEKVLQNFVVYQGDSPFSGYPIVEGSKLMSATLQELVNLGELNLNDGEKIQDNKIVQVPQPAYYYKWNKSTFIWEVDEILLKDGDYLDNGILKTVPRPVDMIVPKWNKVTHIWEEVATDLEKAEYSYNEYMGLNNPNEVRKMTSGQIINKYWEYIDALELFITNARQGTLPLGDIPTPDKKLTEFFNTRFIIGGMYE